MANAKQKATCCLRHFQFSEIEYAKYPSPFIIFSEPPVFIGVSEGDGCYFTHHHRHHTNSHQTLNEAHRRENVLYIGGIGFSKILLFF